MRKPNATRTRHDDGQRTDEFWLGHWEVMQINIAMMNLVEQYRRDAASLRATVKAEQDSGVATIGRLHEYERILEEARKMEADAAAVSALNFAAFQHKDTVAVHSIVQD